MKTIYLTLIVLVAGCSVPPKTNLVVIFDPTEERNAFDNDVLKPAISISHGILTITEIIDQSLSLDTVIAKPPSPPYFLRVESEESMKIDDFDKGVQKGLERFNEPSKGRDQSYVFSTVVRQLNRLALLDDENRKILILGDMMENQKIRFYSYSKNPDDLAGRDYSMLVQKLEKQFNVRDTTSWDGIYVTVCHYPSKASDPLYVAVRAWWSQYLSSRGCRVEFVTSLYSSQFLPS